MRSDDDLAPLEPGVVRISAGRDHYRTEVAVGSHRLVADEPASLGGTDSGPAPYDYLLAGLGACTSITLRMYADRKGWPLEGVRVRLQHRQVHATDCEDCETSNGRVDEITREITLEGPLDDEQRTRLMAIANRCPVHKTLEAEIKIRTRAV